MVERASERLVGVQEVADEMWLVSFMEQERGFSGQDDGHVEPAPNRFVELTEQPLTMSSVRSVALVPRTHPRLNGGVCSLELKPRGGFPEQQGQNSEISPVPSEWRALPYVTH